MNPFQPQRRRRRGAVVGVLGAVLAGLGLWKGRGSMGPSSCPPGEVRVDGHCVANRIAQGGKVDLNVASLDEIAQIPGVGPSLAQAIVSERNRLGKFESFAQLDKVPGIGTARLQALEAYAVVR
jgi:competence protein ComEA